jgi:hypothetical protein
MPIFKELYKGHGVYWHGKHGYGDETNAYTRTLAEYRTKIDAKLDRERAARPDDEKYWDTLTAEERTHWRKLIWDEAQNPLNLSASELAYTHHLATKGDPKP